MRSTPLQLRFSDDKGLLQQGPRLEPDASAHPISVRKDSSQDFQLASHRRRRLGSRSLYVRHVVMRYHASTAYLPRYILRKVPHDLRGFQQYSYVKSIYVSSSSNR